MNFSRVRRIALSWPVLLVGGLFVLYLLLGWFAFEPWCKWALPKMLAERGGYQLRIAQARFDPLRLSFDLRGVALDAPDGKALLAMQRLFVDLDVAGVLQRTTRFAAIRLERPVASIERAADGRVNWLSFVDALGSKEAPATAAAEPAPLPRLRIGHFSIERGRIDFSDAGVPGGFKTQMDPLDVRLDDVSTLRDDRSRYSVDALTDLGARLRWHGDFGLNPVSASGELALDGIAFPRLWPVLQPYLHSAPLQGTAALQLAYSLNYADKTVGLTLDRVNLKVDKLSLSGRAASQPAVALDSLVLSGGHLDLASRRISIDTLALSGARLGLERAADGRLDVQDLFVGRAARDAAAPAAPKPPAPAWHVALKQARVDATAVSVIDHGFVQPLRAELGDLKLSFGAQAQFGGDAPDVDVQGLNAAVARLKLRSGDAAPWFELGSAELHGGSASLAKRQVAATGVLLEAGSLTALRDAQGRLSLAQAFARAAAAAPAPPHADADADAAWHYRVEKIEADKFSASLNDASVSPAASLVLQDIHAVAGPITDAARARVPLRLSLRAASGGRLQAQGHLQPGAMAADLTLKLDGLALAPAQPYLAQVADLTLTSGRFDTHGRLRVAGSKMRYHGSAALHELRLDKTGSSEHLLACKRLSTPRLVLTEKGLDAGELDLAGLDGRLVIFKDRTINVAKVFHKSTAPASKDRAAPQPAYAVNIGQLRVLDSELDFSDLSLALPFAARIHHLQGQVAGLSTTPGREATLELKGQVDRYGLARAAGRVKLLDPTDAMDIKVVFQNVEMTSLTPYSATFAGRRINSGKLSLDLDYKLDKRRLVGENKVVMDKLTLGERVESPTAVNLPLDLALAVLQDSDGRIELGLPVSGSLDDPQFSYGGIIWKAIVNVLTKIVTAPLRALGAMFGAAGGSGDHAPPAITFDAGAASLLPPEREKLDHLAQAMAKHPRVLLEVSAGYKPRSDALALQALALRRALAQHRGQPAADDPGPINLTQPDVRKALESLYARAFGDSALQTLREQHQRANTPASQRRSTWSAVASWFKPTPQPLAPDVAARLHGSDLHALLLQQLQAHEPADEAQLRALADARAQAIQRRLLRHGVAAERVKLEPSTAQPGDGDDVQAHLAIKAIAATAAK